MDGLVEQRFTFQAHRFPPDTFGVVNFTGQEGLSTCYGFDVLLISARRDLDIQEIAGNAVRLSLLREGGQRWISRGIPCSSNSSMPWTVTSSTAPASFPTSSGCR